MDAPHNQNRRSKRKSSIWRPTECEVREAYEALYNGDKSQAVEELYDCAAVLLRAIDVLEGRQALGKPEEAK